MYAWQVVVEDTPARVPTIRSRTCDPSRLLRHFHAHQRHVIWRPRCRRTTFQCFVRKAMFLPQCIVPTRPTATARMPHIEEMTRIIPFIPNAPSEPVCACVCACVCPPSLCGKALRRTIRVPRTLAGGPLDEHTRPKPASNNLHCPTIDASRGRVQSSSKPRRQRCTPTAAGTRHAVVWRTKV